MIALTILFLLVSIVSISALIYVLKHSRKPLIQEAKNEEIPEGVITPLEAVTLDDSQNEQLKIKLKEINQELKKNINGRVKYHSITFRENAEKFPAESIIEIERLYKKAGWHVNSSARNAYDRYGRIEGTDWHLTFTMPENCQLPPQMKKVRVVVEPEMDTGPSLEELGIDSLEEKFKKLEKI
jgi:hypothetical protein